MVIGENRNGKQNIESGTILLLYRLFLYFFCILVKINAFVMW